MQEPPKIAALTETGLVCGKGLGGGLFTAARARRARDLALYPGEGFMSELTSELALPGQTLSVANVGSEVGCS